MTLKNYRASTGRADGEWRFQAWSIIAQSALTKRRKAKSETGLELSRLSMSHNVYVGPRGQSYFISRPGSARLSYSIDRTSYFVWLQQSRESAVSHPSHPHRPSQMWSSSLSPLSADKYRGAVVEVRVAYNIQLQKSFLLNPAFYYTGSPTPTSIHTPS